MNKAKTTRSIEIINYEGPVLKLVGSEFGVIAIDQWDNPVAEFNFSSLLSYLRGEISIYDSKGKKWHYPSQSAEAKTDLNEILLFYQNLKR